MDTQKQESMPFWQRDISPFGLTNILIPKLGQFFSLIQISIKLKFNELYNQFIF